MRRLPRRIHLGPYTIEVALASQAVLRDVMESEDGAYDGAWESLLGEEEKIAGRIYIHDKLPREHKWRVFWHELIHAANDIAGHDGAVSLVL